MMVTSALTPRGRARPGRRDRLSRNRSCSCSAAISASRPAASRRRCSERSCGGASRSPQRPGEPLPPADLRPSAPRPSARSAAPLSEHELASYLMYPKVFVDYARRPRHVRRRQHAADRGVLLRHAAGPGDQHRPGARQDADRALRDDQRRRTRTAPARCSSNSTASRGRSASPTAARSPSGRAHARPSPAIPRTSARRCPARSRRCRCTPGQKVARGDVLLTLEAMKMETTVRAERDGAIAEVLVERRRCRSTPRTCWWCSTPKRSAAP